MGDSAFYCLSNGRSFTGQVIEIVRRFGRLKVLDDRELVVEVERMEDFQNLQKALSEAFGGEVEAERVLKK
jgi:hypothetical protein